MKNAKENLFHSNEGRKVSMVRKNYENRAGRIPSHLIISNLFSFAMYINFKVLHTETKVFSKLVINNPHKCTNNEIVVNRYLLTLYRLK